MSNHWTGRKTLIKDTANTAGWFGLWPHEYASSTKLNNSKFQIGLVLAKGNFR